MAKVRAGLDKTVRAVRRRGRESKITLKAATDQMNPSQTISFMESMN